MKSSNIISVNMYCPNCGHKLVGLGDDGGAVKIFCNRCKVIVFSKRRNNKINIQVIKNN